MSEKINLTEETKVNGNITHYDQSYKIVYYPEERTLKETLRSKISLYIDLKSIHSSKKEPSRSIYFYNLEQLKGLITDLIKAYFFFNDKINIPDIEIAKYRQIKLNSFLDELRAKQLGEWKK